VHYYENLQHYFRCIDLRKMSIPNRDKTSRGLTGPAVHEGRNATDSEAFDQGQGLVVDVSRFPLFLLAKASK
jgi:hypothetical protein